MAVYFVQKLREDRSIKIGYVTESYTESLSLRVGSIPAECGVPVKLLGCVAGVQSKRALLCARC